MTRRQKYIIVALAIANATLLAAVLVFVTRFSGSVSPLGLPTPVSTYRAPTRFSPACRLRAVEMLSQAGLGGTTTLTDQTVQFDLVYLATKGTDVDDVAQQVWTAFDIALVLANEQCETFSHVQIVIKAQGTQRPTHVYATVDLVDLKAFYGGDLNESTFIDRVQYRIEPVDNSEL